MAIYNQHTKPSKIMCIGRNYAAHIEELGNEIPDDMVVFLKPPSSVTTTLNSQHNNDDLHFETEICFKIESGRLAYVGVGLDLTKRELQAKLKAKGLPWERAKAFDGAALFSDFVAIKSEDIANLQLTLLLDGDVQQQGNIDLMLYKPQAILNEIKSFMSLVDGDIIMTGTPAGVGKVKANSQFKAQLSCNNKVLIEKQWLAS